MKRPFTKYNFSLILLIPFLVACFQSEYTRMVKNELAKGVRKDSIILGINLGDSKDDFFGKCMDLNAQHLITQGNDGTSVQYLFVDSIEHQTPAHLRLLFKPVYDDKEKIAEIQMEFSHQGWAPWNEKLQSKVLFPVAEKILLNWYEGNNFVDAEVAGQKLRVKVDGNRRILMYIKSDQSIAIQVQDLLHPNFKHSKQ